LGTWLKEPVDDGGHLWNYDEHVFVFALLNHCRSRRKRPSFLRALRRRPGFPQA
jgi:hypothetical protein